MTDNDTPDAAVVALLVDLDWTRRTLLDVDWTQPLEGANTCYRDNGQPFTPEEMRLLSQARRADLEASLRYGAAVVQYAKEEADDANRVYEIAKPYFDSGAETLGEVRELLAPDEAVEFDEIMSRCAPDGYLVIGPQG